MVIKKLYLVHYGLTHIALPKILYKFPLKVHIFWSSKIYSKNCIRGNMVWPILSFQGSYKCSPNSHIYFGVKNLLKNCIRDRNLRNLNYGQFSLNYIVHLENINQFLSKAQIANSDQDQIWFEPLFFQRFYMNKLFFAAWNTFGKFQSGTIQIDPYCAFSELWSIFIKITCNLIYVEFCNVF